MDISIVAIMRRACIAGLVLYGLSCAAVMAAPGLSKPVIEIKGSYADVAAEKGLLYLAVRNAENPEPDIRIFRSGGNGAAEIGTYTTKGYARSLALHGNHLHVAIGNQGLEIVDIGDPARPVLAAAMALGGYSHRVAVWRNMALVASGFGGMHIVDIADPKQPKLLSTYQAYTPPGDEDDAGAAEDDGGMFPKNGDRLEDPAPLDQAKFFGDEWWESDEDGGENGGPSLEELSRLEGALDVVTDGRLAYLAYGSAGLVIVDISDPRKPRKVIVIEEDQRVESVALDGSTLYVTAGVKGVEIFDVARPETPVRLGIARTACYPMGLAVHDGRIYVADGYCGRDGLIVMDAGKARAPRVAYTLSGGGGNVRIYRNRLFLMGQNRMRAFRIIQ